MAVCHAVERSTGKSLSIKWVNDVYTSQGKCCGILTEAATDLENSGLDYLVVGIGLNLFPPHNGWPQEVQNIAASIFQSNEQVNRCRVVAQIANELLKLCDELPNIDFMSEYRARNTVPGHQIMILQNGVSRPALVQAITDEGHLLVTLPDGNTEQLSFGEVSICL